MATLAQNILRKVIHAVAAIALLTGTASAQIPGINLSGDAPALSPEEQEKRKATEDAYKSALKKIPEKKTAADPWGDIRSNPSASPKTKQGRQ